MTTLPGAVRAELEGRIRIALLDLVERQDASDGTSKFLWRLPDGSEVESVAIPSGGRVTFCVSSQVGCALRCRFCATGYLGLTRNLTTGEILDQVLAMLASLPPQASASNVVFMGMGEPGYNVGAVLDACRRLNDPGLLRIGARHLTVSTAGVVPMIEALAREPLQVRLAVSLHSAIQARRVELMDVAGRYPLPELEAACLAYHASTARHITFEYAVIPGWNDGPADARALAGIARRIPCKINLIPYNPVAGFQARAATSRDAEAFRTAVLQGFSGEVVVRRTRGRDINGACGMLHRARRDAAGPA
jgi:23S rRNA (adenine2503-C2)-methyltransferase